MGISINTGINISQGQLTFGPTSPSYSLWAWGWNNSNGQLGLGDINDRSSPVQVGALTDWASIEAGGVFTAAIKTKGSLWTWGANYSGQLGDNTIVFKSSPVQIGTLGDWASVNSKDTHSLALKTDNSLWAWGNNGSGRLGDGTIIDRSSPVQIGILTDWTSVSAGTTHSTAIKNDGSLWTWGRADNGRLGNNNATLNRSSPVQVGALTNWTSISAGVAHSTAIKNDGSLWTWGDNGQGNLGDGTTVTRSSPIQIGVLTDWISISSGGNWSIALKTNGSLWAWGQNTTNGNLGLGDKINRSSPVQVGSLTDWAIIETGSRSGLVRKTDNTLWVWGGNDSRGPLGLGDKINRSSPVQISSDTNWASLDGGIAHTVALKLITS